MDRLFKALNKIPPVKPGEYSRFSVVLYGLLKKAYPHIEMEIVRTGEGVAVLAINGFIINPYVGITVGYNFEEYANYENNLDYFLERDLPKTQEVIDYIDELTKVINEYNSSMPLTLENINADQSERYKDSLAIDLKADKQVLCYNRKTKVYEKSLRNGESNIAHYIKPTTVESKYRFPQTNGLHYSFKVINVDDDLEIELLDNSYETPIDKLGDPDYTKHFVPGEYKGTVVPKCDIESIIEYQKCGDFIAGGIFNDTTNTPRIRYNVYSKNEKCIKIHPGRVLCTLVLIVNGMTVHSESLENESEVGVPFQK